MPTLVRCLLAAGWLSSLLWPTPACAEETLAGTWNAGPLTESISIVEWTDECGPKPASRSEPGGAFRVTTSGDELVFAGARTFRTDQCWDRDSAKRVSHSASPSPRSWRTRCESPASDPRRAILSTSYTLAGESTIALYESGTYAITVAAGSCSAKVVRTRTFSLVARDGAAPATTAPSAAASTTATSPVPTVAIPAALPSAPAPAIIPTADRPAEAACAKPGEAAVLELRPRRKLLRAGDTFEVQSRVLDVRGCELVLKPTLRLEAAPAGVSLDAMKVRTIPSVKPATFFVVAESGKRQAKIEVEVTTEAAYADLLAKGGLDDAGTDNRPVSVSIATIQGEATSNSRSKEDDTRSVPWMVVFAGVVTVGGALAVFSIQRRARRRHVPLSPTSPLKVALPLNEKPQKCPVCDRRFEAEAKFCSKDGSPLVR